MGRGKCDYLSGAGLYAAVWGDESLLQRQFGDLLFFGHRAGMERRGYTKDRMGTAHPSAGVGILFGPHGPIPRGVWECQPVVLVHHRLQSLPLGGVLWATVVRHRSRHGVLRRHLLTHTSIHHSSSRTTKFWYGTDAIRGKRRT